LAGTDWTPAGLCLAVVASGLYHGVSPGMGWPLAVSAGLMERSSRALAVALWPLTVGHLLAMLVVLLPFALLVAIVEWQRQIQIGASLLVIGFGTFRFLNRRHPRVLARIRPTQLGLWSFARRNAFRRPPIVSCDLASRNPITGIAGCCACASSGHAVRA